MTDKLKIGLLDLLTLLLPGGFLLFILVRGGFVSKFVPAIYQISATSVDAWPKVVLYITVSYVAGHFIYLLASNLDGWVYDNVRKVFWKDRRLAAYILQRKAMVTGIEDRDIINGFKWSSAWLLKNAPTMYAEVERIMAESKFFRSLVVVCFVSFLLLVCTGDIRLAILMLILVILSLFRYLVQRQKSIDTAYIYMITALSEEKPFPAVPDREKLFELTKAIVSVPNLARISPYEYSKKAINLRSFTNTVREITEVIKLCIWPFYRYEILPRNNPDFKGQEVRWFFQEDPVQFASWLRGLCGEDLKMPDERSDTYYIKSGMRQISIKDRAQTNAFEIKRKLPLDERIAFPGGAQAVIESWYKWIVAAKDADAMKVGLIAGKYTARKVQKKRWLAKIPTAGEGWLMEYTIVNVDGLSTWYTIALELPFDAGLDKVEAVLKGIHFFEKVSFAGAKAISYPEFLYREVEQ